MRLRRLAPLIAVAAACIAATPGHGQFAGQSRLKQSQYVWKLMDACRRNAFKRFPDYTPQSNAQRKRAEQQCMEANNLPYPPPQENAAQPPKR